MPLPKPKERPGTPLFPEDKAAQQKSTPPQKSGTFGEHGWAAWWRRLDYKDAGGIWEYVIFTPECKPLYTSSYRGGRYRSERWHRIHPVEGLQLETQIQRRILRRLLGQETKHPPEVHEVISSEVHDLLYERRAGPYQNELEDDEVSTWYDSDGAHHSVKRA